MSDPSEPIEPQPQPNTTNKLWVGGAAGSTVIVLNWVLKTWAGVEMPTEVAMAASTIISLLAAHFTPVGADGRY